NLLARPGVGLIFFVPGINETLRVNGRASITTDPALLEPLAVNGKVPRSGILIAAEEVYFHCGKALIRSDLWNPDKHLPKGQWPAKASRSQSRIGKLRQVARRAGPVAPVMLSGLGKRFAQDLCGFGEAPLGGQCRAERPQRLG